MAALDAGYTPDLTPQEEEALTFVFTYQSPNARQIEQMWLIREEARKLALTILRNCPRSADRSAAIRKLREAVMTANSAIVLNGHYAG